MCTDKWRVVYIQMCWKHVRSFSRTRTIYHVAVRIYYNILDNQSDKVSPDVVITIRETWNVIGNGQYLRILDEFATDSSGNSSEHFPRDIRTETIAFESISFQLRSVLIIVVRELILTFNVESANVTYSCSANVMAFMACLHGTHYSAVVRE